MRNKRVNASNLIVDKQIEMKGPTAAYGLPIVNHNSVEYAPFLSFFLSY